MNMRKDGKRRRLKIGIRPQLIILVCFSSLFSLLILAVVTGVYYSTNLTNLRAERLEVIAQIKASQIEQTVQYLLYQTYWLSTKDSIAKPLSNYRAGNSSKAVFGDAQYALDSFLSSSEMFASAALYDLNSNIVAESRNNNTKVSSTLESALYALTENTTIPSAIQQSSSSVDTRYSPELDVYITGPLPNDTSKNATYFMGITLPVYSNSSIILQTAAVAGYLTVIADADIIKLSLEYFRSSGDNKYSVSLVKAYYENATVAGDGRYATGFELLFPVEGDDMIPNQYYVIDSSPVVKHALVAQEGVVRNADSLDKGKVAAGFATMDIDLQNYWTVMIEQKRSTFQSPVVKLRNIMIGVVIGIGVFMCLITFPLAVWFVAPITRLKNATEAITRSRKEKDKGGSFYGSGGRHDDPNGDGGGDKEVLSSSSNDGNGDEQDKNIVTTNSKRNSVKSFGTGSTAFSTGIRLPDRIPPSKKLFKDELTELSDAFNIMTAELEKQYTHLEDRVKSRTKELEASKIEAEAANESKTIFIANISHELRTPLNGILGMTSIAMDDDDPSSIQDSLKLIHRSGELLLHILTELLTYSKNTLNRSKLEKSNFQVLEILYQIKSIFGKLALDQRVNLNISLRPNFLRKLILYGDSNRIIQVVMNLVSNSLKFTPVDGSVDVSFKLLGEYDHDRSRAADYEKVYVKKDHYLFTPNTMPSVRKTYSAAGDRRASESAKSNTSRRGGDYINKNGTTSADIDTSGQSQEAINDDNQSIVTLSTTEYENAIFHSQFNNNKSLPDLPRSRQSLSPATSMNSSDSHRDVEGNNALVEKNSSSPQKGLENVHLTEKLASTEMPNTGSSQSTNSHLAAPMAEKGQEASLKKTNSCGTSNLMSTNAFISNSELVKNDKVYKMRKLYIPRSWVLQIEVKDTGSGIEPALQEKVFEPFIQGDQTLSRSYGGTGLGLSICRQLAKMMKGTLTLKSTLGQGSTFTFTVPLPQNGEILVPEDEMEEFCNDVFNPEAKINRKVAFGVAEEPHSRTHSKEESEVSEPDIRNGGAPSDASSNNKASPKKGFQLKLPQRHNSHLSSTGTAERNKSGISFLNDLTHLKILVAEDNSVNQEVIRRMLRLEGFHNVTMASNGLEAVDCIKSSYETGEHFNIIFMDVQMPKMDGLTATKLIRNNLKFRKPIIALTAFADESNVKECLNSGMSGFLSKPIKRTNLRQIITEFSTEVLSEIVTTPVTYTDDDERRLA
ncbi:Histidine kinase osmosensor [Candidozyma auris]